MDKNTVWGLIIIGVIMFGFSYFTRPSEEEINALRTRDSIAQVQKITEKAIVKDLKLKEAVVPVQIVSADSTNISKAYGVFTDAVNKEEKFSVLENDLVKIKFTNKGGRVYSVEIKNYKTYDSKPLILWDGDDNDFGLQFTANAQSVDTQNLFFTADNSSDSKAVSMKLNASDNQYIEYKYTLADDSYMLDFDINVVNLDNIISRRTKDLAFNWTVELNRKEKGVKFENQYTNIVYRNAEEDIETLSATGEDDEKTEGKVKWFAFKQQFFSSVLIAKSDFNAPSFKSVANSDETLALLKTFNAEILFPYEGKANESYQMQFFFGPNHYPTLREYGKDIDLHKIIDLGWPIIREINRFVVIPIFNGLEGFIGNYGIIILILTLIIKLALSPLTYKSYLSTAKMKVLKPQIDEINERIPKDKAMERQQATMALYKKAGVNPLGGCLPMLVQMPILFAMFRFFPASIELRQQSFLWAEDLSSYDSIYDLGFNIPFYGDHISLFCILMAATNIIYTSMNNQMQSSQQMPGMKVMMYFMPIMFLGMFNNYASGLSYYYFIATLFTVLQTWAIRKYLVDDEKVLAKIEDNKKKTVKKSKFQQKLEDVARQRANKR